MICDTENCMAVDSEWNEVEYGIPDKRRMKRQRRAYEEAEMEDREYE